MTKIIWTGWCIFSAIACFCLRSADASVCKPNSEFKVDCNTCTCSSSGMEFSCTDIICEPLIYKNKYLIEQDEKGYSILKPKANGEVVSDNKLNHNNDLFIDNSIKDKYGFQRDQRYVLDPPAFDRVINSENILYDDPTDNKNAGNDVFDTESLSDEAYDSEYYDNMNYDSEESYEDYDPV